ncbi:peptidylprolyl isomerase [Thiohalobacter sp. IOR34]|uniref:FKBP-type peptidyl-prolyl cis-trans isomerase n=1 Tax=Thiohalobacter sp. IOR34 TaxID=3057176 RepID=UPI0025B26A49|nr:peptidylprolyl isomerase [Thiohalobacter sp. IOR34]WJW75097.1 peptidylprolyl isomerase [Thiohalobacter sp. IOR34]
MTALDVISPGSRVRLHLRLSLADGTVVEDSYGGEPLEFVIGDGTLVQGLERALYGMRPGQSQRLTLHPEQAFGAHDPALVTHLPRARFPDDIVPEPGLVIEFETAEGEFLPGLVLAVEGDQVEVDLNHPLAGKPVILENEILAVDNSALLGAEGED